MQHNKFAIEENIMNKILMILLIYNCIIAKVKNESMQRNNRDDSKSENGSSNRISKTLENILRNMNVSTINFQDRFTTQWTENKIIKILLNGTAEDIKEISRQDLIDNLWIINKLNIPIEKQYSLWFVLKGDDQINELKRSDLENLSNLFSTISEMDLINLNVTDDEIINYLGIYKHFTNRQLGILVYSLKLENSTKNIPENIEFVNKIKGLLCGFGETHLEIINPNDFKLINDSVFKNLWGCNKNQLKSLLKIAQHQEAYGPILTWTKNVVSKLSFVITAMEQKELRKIPAESFGEIIPEVIQKFDVEQIEALTNEQIKHLQNSAYATYKTVMNVKSEENSGKNRNIVEMLGVFISVLVFLVI